MDLRVAPAGQWPVEVAEALSGVLRAQPAARLVLPTGQTPLPVYDLLARSAASWDRASVLLLDEFGGLPPGEPGGCDATLRRALVDAVKPAEYRPIDAAACDLAAECEAVDLWIDDGGLTLAVLGLGGNGHLGMNEPGDDPALRTHRVELAPSTVEAADRYFEGRCRPTWGVTVGLADLLAAERVWVLVTGAAKADVVARSVRGPVDPGVPASLLQQHPRCTWWLDEAAASALP